MKNGKMIGGIVGGLVLGVLGFSLLASAKNKFSSKGTETIKVGNYTATDVVNNVATDVTYSLKKIDPNNSQVILLEDTVTGQTVDSIIDELEKARQDGEKKVYLVINSPGGSVFDGARLVSYIKSSDMEINTVCETLCASMAFHIFETGKHRLMIDKSVLMAHPASGGAQGTVNEMKNMIDMIAKYTDRMDADVAKRSGIPYDVWKNMVVNNVWLEARDAVDKHLADEVVSFQNIKSKGAAASPRNSDEYNTIIDFQ